MSPAADKSECLRFDRWLMAYVDDELDAVHVLEVEDHLESCGECSELVDTLMATRSSLKVACQMVAPSSLRDRVGRTLLAEKLVDENVLSSIEGVASSAAGAPENSEEQTPSSQPEPGPSVRPAEPTLVKLRYVLPLAAAATFALLFGAMHLERQDTPSASTPYTTASVPLQGLASLDALVDELVTQHANPPPPETTDPDKLGRFEPFVGVNVRRPRFKNPDIHWVGARMVNSRAAMHQYRVHDKQRMTVYVFDPRKVRIDGSRLHERHMGPYKVYVGRVSGYSVAASERNGVGYALASDLSPDESAQLMVAAK